MKMSYDSQKWSNPKSKLDDSWVIYEIDTSDLDLKIYKDPNFIDGYYILSNIPTNKIKIIEREC